jgi:5-methylthioadenosine/S-adenosylhomocysteine deaminase
MEQIDTLIHARWVIPVEPSGTVHQHAAIAVQGGRIVEVLPSNNAATRYAARETVQLTEHAVIPGFVNVHTHAAMALFRGLADDLPLMQWLQEHIWPAEAKWVSPEFVHDGAALAIAEMLKSGTTCFGDMYFFPEETARACSANGMRAVVGLILIDFPTAYAQDPEEYLHKGLKLRDDLRTNDLVTTAFAPHAPYTVSDSPLTKLRMLNDELNLPLQMHVHETAHEVAEAERASGQRPLARLKALGLLQPNLIAVHMTQLLDEEIAWLAESRVNVAHCPESNLKLASGFCPVHKLMQAGVNVALGTDGAASNNDLDMLSEMRTAALLAKGVAQEATALPAAAALRMATLNGARALGLDSRIGSLEAGKAADLVAIDLSTVPTQPVYDPISQIVYAAGREQVTDVWVNGRRLLQDRKLTALDETAVLEKAARWRVKIRP